MSGGHVAWHVLGKGAVGCLLAAYLRRSGAAVRLLHRSKKLGCQDDTIGIRVQPAWACGKDESLPQAWTVDVKLEHVSQVSTAPINHLLVTTKSFDAANAVKSVVHKLHRGAVVVLLTNGMGVLEDVLAQPDVMERAPQLVVGTNSNGSYMTREFDVVHAGRGQVWMGCIGNRCSPSSFQVALSSLQKSGLGVERDEHIEISLWKKLACNSSLNPITALAKCKNGQTLSRPELQDAINSVCEEVAALMVHCAIVKDADSKLLASQLVEFTVDVAARNANNYSSMYQDVQHMRRTEIDFMNGYIMSKAKAEGLPVPTTALLYGLIKLLEEGFPKSSSRL